MIKINLLPVRAAKKKETAVQQASIFGGGVLLVCLITLTFYLIVRMQISNTKDEITTANNVLAELKKKIGKLEELKSLKEQVKKKLDVLDLLRKNKSGPAQRLATLSDITPEKLWLTAYSESGEQIKLSGLAFNEELIASFMKNLEASIDYMSVELVVTEQNETAGTKLKKFDITCKLEPPKISATPTASGSPQQPAKSATSQK